MTIPNLGNLYDYISRAIDYPIRGEAQLISMVILHFNIPDDEASRLVRSYLQAYRAGMKKGIWLYAWWKDGVQYVGTSGRTLKQALEEVDKNG